MSQKGIFQMYYSILRSCDRASWQILIIKPTRCTNLSYLFWDEILHVSDRSAVHCQEFFTVHTAMVYVIQTCMTLPLHPDPAWKLSTNLYDIYHCILILLENCLQTCMTYHCILILLESCLQTSRTYTIAVCKVKDAWCLTEELSETCRVSFQNKFEK